MMTISLTEPTIFTELNIQEGLNPNHTRDTITIETLKYKHIRAALQYPEADQMHHLMKIMTNLSENDLGELSPEDAAKIGLFLHQELNKFNNLTNPSL